MVTAIIAEDEILVRLGLSISFDWANAGIRVVAEVANGTDAYEAFLKYRPDIIITDIRMPGMDGLTLIRRIRAVDERCAIIVISALTDFETLHSVMQNDATAYLIKATMTREEIRAAIQKALAHLLRHPRGNEDAEEPHVRRHELLRRYAVDRELSLEGLRAELDALGTEAPRIAGALMVSAHGAPGAGMAAQSARKLLLQRLALKDGDMHFDEGEMLLVLFTESGPPLPSRLALDTKTQDEYAFDNFRLHLRLCHCPDTIPLSDLPAFVASARAALGTSWLFDAQTVRLSASGMVEDEDLNRLYAELDGHIERTLHSLGEWKDARHALDRLRQSARSRGEFLKLLSVLAALLLPGSKIDRALEGAATLKEAIDIFDASVLSHMQVDDATNRAQLTAVMRYMQGHLREELHLSEMAAMANLSPGYFSTLLKQLTGMRFSEYVSTLRIERAKELLKNPALTIQRVAELCGLPDIAYFSRSFKTKVGLTPSQWRKA